MVVLERVSGLGEVWFAIIAWLGLTYHHIDSKPKDAGQEEECCAHRPIGLHKYKLPEEIVKLDHQFFGRTDGQSYKQLKAKTKKYVDKVRNAMGISSEL